MPIFLDRYLLPITHLLLGWLGVVGTVCAVYARTHATRYFRVGPGPGLFFVGFVVDSWHKWAQVVVIVVLSQVIYMLAMESVSPWIMNTVMDPKTTRIPTYSYTQIQYICNVYYTFAAVVQLVQVQVVVAQADLAAIVVLVDLLVSLVTTHLFVRGKEAIGPTESLPVDGEDALEDALVPSPDT